jgi:hypothetical protein
MKGKTSKKQTNYKTTEIFAAQERHASSSSSSSSSSSVTFDTPQSTQDARETKPKTLLTEPYQQPSLSLSFPLFIARISNPTPNWTWKTTAAEEQEQEEKYKKR